MSITVFFLEQISYGLVLQQEFSPFLIRHHVIIVFSLVMKLGMFKYSNFKFLLILLTQTGLQRFKRSQMSELSFLNTESKQCNRRIQN